MSAWVCMKMDSLRMGLGADGGTRESLGLRGDGCMEMRADSDSPRMGLHRDE